MLMEYTLGMDVDIRQQNKSTSGKECWLRSGSGMTCSLNPLPSLLSSLLRYTTSSSESCKQHTEFSDAWS